MTEDEISLEAERQRRMKRALAELEALASRLGFDLYELLSDEEPKETYEKKSKD